MKRVLLDSSVYGALIKDSDSVMRLDNHLGKDMVIYGNAVIRRELKDTPKHIIYGKRKVQILLLNLYDSLVRKPHHDLQINFLVEQLAAVYAKECRQQRIAFSREELDHDMLIIACAVIHKLDIVVSDDERTMLSQALRMVYASVNNGLGLENPCLITYNTFKELLRR